MRNSDYNDHVDDFYTTKLSIKLNEKNKFTDPLGSFVLSEVTAHNQAVMPKITKFIFSITTTLLINFMNDEKKVMKLSGV